MQSVLDACVRLIIIRIADLEEKKLPMETFSMGSFYMHKSPFTAHLDTHYTIICKVFHLLQLQEISQQVDESGCHDYRHCIGSLLLKVQDQSLFPQKNHDINIVECEYFLLVLSGSVYRQVRNMYVRLYATATVDNVFRFIPMEMVWCILSFFQI